MQVETSIEDKSMMLNTDYYENIIAGSEFKYNQRN